MTKVSSNTSVFHRIKAFVTFYHGMQINALYSGGDKISNALNRYDTGHDSQGKRSK